MFNFISTFFGSDKKRYEKHKEILKSGTKAQRQELAEAKNTDPEILYYLAKDENSEIRKSIAINKSTPVHASTLLANDKSVDVREALVTRLVDLLPNLSTEEHSKLYAYATQALKVLAQDEVFNIRKALSTSLKDYANAPPQVVGQLARDVEREVSEPILKFCLALDDEDLLDILGQHPDPWVITAIAKRPIVSEPVANAVIDTKDLTANKALIHNTGAKLVQSTINKIIEYARECPEIHTDLVTKRDLSFDLAQRIAGIVNSSILKILEKRTDFDKESSKQIAAMVKRRMEFFNQSAPYETAESKIERYIKNKKLNVDVIGDALAWNDHAFVLLGIAKMANIHPVIAEKMLKMGSAKSVIALCWKAKIPMRTAIIIQRDYSKLKPSETLYAKDGTGYPMAQEDIQWQLEFYGI